MVRLELAKQAIKTLLAKRKTLFKLALIHIIA